MKISNINPQIEKDDDGSILYHSSTRACYDDGSGATDGSNVVNTEIKIRFSIDENGKLLVAYMEY